MSPLHRLRRFPSPASRGRICGDEGRAPILPRLRGRGTAEGGGGGCAASSFSRHGFRYQIAGPEHDAEIARLLNDNEIPGWISLSYRTKPGWHRPLARSFKSDTIIGVNEQSRAGGIATRSIHRAFLNGREQAVGWLGQLRIDRSFRHRAHLLRAGFEAVETLLHDADETPHYYASIIDGNEPARRILGKGLEGFPRFEPLFGYQVLAISTAGAGRVAPEAVDMDQAAAFLNEQNRGRDLAVRINADEIVRGEWAGLEAEDFIVLRSDSGSIGGVAAIWDQHPYRSISVAGYKPPLGRLRPLLNLAAPLTGLLKLPAVGQDLRQAYLSFATVKDDDPDTWVRLVRAALGVARTKGAQLLAAGFVDGDPAAEIVAKAFQHRLYRSTIYRVTFAGDLGRPAPALRNPKVEIGLL